MRKVRSYLLLLLFISSIYFISGISSVSTVDNSPQVSEFTKGRPEGVIRLMSYNIWETGHNITWINAVQEVNPDIAVFVETGKWNPKDGTFTKALEDINAMFPNEKKYAGYTTEAVSSTDGEAVISRYPIKLKSQISELTLDDGSKRKPGHDFVHVVVEIDGQDVHIIGNHLNCCDSGLENRLLDQEGIINFMDSLGDVPIIYAGDFNSLSPQDKGEISANDENLGDEPIDMLLNQSHPKASKTHKFIDVYRTLNPYNKGYTYIDNQYSSRIDYIFVNEFLEPTLVNSTVHTTYYGRNGADHMPVVANLNFRYDEFDLRPPEQVKTISTSEATGTSLKIEWSDNTDSDFFKYQIYRDSCLITELPKGTITFTDSGLNANSYHMYGIRTIDTKGNGGASRDFFVNTSYGKITTPDIPVVKAEAIAGGKINLTWTVADNGGAVITNYNIYKSASETATPIYFASTNETNFVHNIGTSGITVYYTVSATNFAGTSKQSEKVSATTTGYSSSVKSSQQSIFIGLTESSGDCPAPLQIIDLPTESNNTTSPTEPSDTDNGFLGFPVLFTITFIGVLVITRKYQHLTN